MSATAEYIDRVARGESLRTDERRLTPDERLGDALFTGLRLCSGLDLDEVNRRYGADVWGRYGDELQPFVEEGILIRDGSILRLTRRGMLLANEVMAVFV